MDPACASIALIGFAASLATLAGLVIESAQTLTALCLKLSNAPADLKRFLLVLQQHEALLVELRARVTFFTDDEIPMALQLLWQQNITQMAADYTQLKTAVNRIKAWFGGESTTNKNIRARVRSFFIAPEILQLQEHLRDHVDRFHIVLSMINDYRLRTQKVLLGDISRNVISKSAIQQSKLEKLDLQTSRSEGYLRQQAVQLSGLQHQLRFISAQLRKVPHGSDYVFRESRFQSVNSDHSTQTGRLPWSCLSRHLSYWTAGRSEVFLVRHYWFGSLEANLSYNITGEDDQSPSSITENAHLDMTYVAPSWLSDMLIRISLASSTTLAMRRCRINRDPRIMNCLASCDVPGLKALFDQGLAHPLDVVLDDVTEFDDDAKPMRHADDAVPRTIMEAFLRWSKGYRRDGLITSYTYGPNKSSDIEGGYHMEQSWSNVYRLLDKQLEGMVYSHEIEKCDKTTHFEVVYLLTTSRTLVDLMENQAYERKEVIDIILQRGVDIALVLNSTTWHCRHTILLLLYAAGPRHYVHDLVNRYLSLDDYWAMTPANSWLLRSIARCDMGLRTKLLLDHKERRQKADSGPTQREVLDFSVQTQLDEMRQSDHKERDLYISSICAGGTAEDLDTLIHSARTICELDTGYRNGHHLRHYLETSAALGNRATFFRLIEAGADAITRQDRLWALLSREYRVPAFFNNAASTSRERSEMMRKLLSTMSPALAKSLTSTLISLQPGPGIYRLSAWLRGDLVLDLSRIEKRTHSSSTSDAFRRDADGAILAAAVVYQNSTVVDKVLDLVSELEWEDPNGLTPLMMAIVLRSFESVKKLIALGADTGGVKSCGFSAIFLMQRMRELQELTLRNVDTQLQRKNSQTDCKYDSKVYINCEEKDEFSWRLRSEFGGSVCRFLDSVLIRDPVDPRAWIDSCKDFDAAIRELGFLDVDEDSKNLRSKDLSSMEEPGWRHPDLAEWAIKLLVASGYLVGILAHIGYDVWDSLAWVARLPSAIIRILALATLVITSAFLWKTVLAYWSASPFRAVYAILVVAVTVVFWMRPSIKEWWWRDVTMRRNSMSETARQSN
ncbi:hypothetical protein H2200_005726 [Cladophialophora chaetospira]|uniref:Ankyrin repeat protein n=1 Tax=Cladophialophora chaetospira TaxID=386627 RepID=A0AA38X9L2_9EURO|nr:hypothetical protein H2200_005726 [Cladophialophora chaetospira]